MRTVRGRAGGYIVLEISTRSCVFYKMRIIAVDRVPRLKGGLWEIAFHLRKEMYIREERAYSLASHYYLLYIRRYAIHKRNLFFSSLLQFYIILYTCASAVYTFWITKSVSHMNDRGKVYFVNVYR
jgi:hypothetical protein